MNTVREDVGCNQMLNMASLSCDQQPNRPIYNITITFNVKDVISAPLASQKNRITKIVLLMFPPHTNNTHFLLFNQKHIYFFNGFGSRSIFPIHFFFINSYKSWTNSYEVNHSITTFVTKKVRIDKKIANNIKSKWWLNINRFILNMFMFKYVCTVCIYKFLIVTCSFTRNFAVKHNYLKNKLKLM